MTQTRQHDLLYLHLALASADGTLNMMERHAMKGVVARIVKDDTASAQALIAGVAERMAEPESNRALLLQYEETLARVAEKMAGRQRACRSLLRSLLDLAGSDGRRLAIEEVLMLKSAAVALGLSEALLLDEDTRSMQLSAP